MLTFCLTSWKSREASNPGGQDSKDLTFSEVAEEEDEGSEAVVRIVSDAIYLHYDFPRHQGRKG